MKRNRTSYSPDFKRRIIKLHKAGFSIDQLHRLYSINKSTLRSWLKLEAYIDLSVDETHFIQDFKKLYEMTQLDCAKNTDTSLSLFASGTS